MRVLVRSGAGRFSGSHRGILLVHLVLLLHGVILSLFTASTTVAAARIHVRETELQRSLSRYRQPLEEHDSNPNLVKPQEQQMRLEEQKETKTEGDDAAENPVKDLEVHQAVQEGEPEVQKNDKPEVKENENLNSETIEEQEGDQEKKTDETHQEDEPKLDIVGKVEEEVESSAKAEDQQDQGEDREAAPEVEKTDQQSESSNTEFQDPGEERKEPDVKTDEQQSEEGDSSTEENKSEERKESDPKTEDENNGERKNSESNAEEQKAEEGQEASDSKAEEEKPAEKEPFVFPEPYLLGPTIKDWDEQRGSWLDANPHMKTTSDGKPRVLIITGSQPDPCRSPVGDNFNLRSLKLKMDYARMHNYEIYYNFVWLDPLFGSYWVKLPILRNLMLTHPEIEWFFWIDSDALFTDMLFEAPFDAYEGYNMIMWGYHQGFYVEKSWVAFNAGVFIIRNCQWTLDLLDKWSPMGPDGLVREEYGKMLTDFLTNRIQNYPADDQSALAYLMLTDEAVKSKVKLIDLSEYMVSAWWVEVVDNYETSMEKYHPGLGDFRWPWITHFTGCGPCNGDGGNPDYQKCMKNIDRALNFADNQVLAYMGFQHESLSSESLLRIRNETDRPLDFVGRNPWEERIAQVAAAAA